MSDRIDQQRHEESEVRHDWYQSQQRHDPYQGMTNTEILRQFERAMSAVEGMALEEAVRSLMDDYSILRVFMIERIEMAAAKRLRTSR